MQPYTSSMESHRSRQMPEHPSTVHWQCSAEHRHRCCNSHDANVSCLEVTSKDRSAGCLDMHIPVGCLCHCRQHLPLHHDIEIESNEPVL